MCVCVCVCLQGMAELIAGHMERDGTRFLRHSVPLRLEQHGKDQILVTWETRQDQSPASQHQEVFDTVLFATGNLPVFSF